MSYSCCSDASSKNGEVKRLLDAPIHLGQKMKNKGDTISCINYLGWMLSEYHISLVEGVWVCIINELCWSPNW